MNPPRGRRSPARRSPGSVFAGHVPNYQRWEHPLAGGGDPLPFIVSGAGGYWNLHHIMTPDRSVPALCPTPTTAATGCSTTKITPTATRS